MCGIATSFHTLVAFRVIQGVSAAVIVPVAMPLGLNLVPKEKQGMIGGVMGALGISSGDWPFTWRRFN